jgi:hypothetical protein
VWPLQIFYIIIKYVLHNSVNKEGVSGINTEKLTDNIEQKKLITQLSQEESKIARMSA